MAQSAALPQKIKDKSVNYLDLIPSPILSHQIEESGLVTLLVPRFRSPFWSRFINQHTPKKDILLKLDELGSSTWILLDGKRTVEQICIELTLTLGEKIHPAEERVTKFLSQLYRNKFISFYLSPSPGNNS
ncbi:MAG: PqqD family protein [Bacteroidetes bacterium]|nr:PqqD family protein [Bacteroidota bacterium]